MRRELLEETMEVYPIDNYGAIQIGEHQFYNTIKGDEEKLMDTYKFLHIWKKGENGWQITKVVSYVHQKL